MKKIKGIILLSLLCFISGCSSNTESSDKVITYGTTAYGTAMGNAGLDPHNNYMGWSTLRYGVGETLFKFNEAMELEPWLAKETNRINETTITITLRDDILFSNGKKVTAQEVKDCFERLLETHERAANDLDIKEMQAEGQTLTIITNSPCPTILNSLSDPYGVIIDVEAGVDTDYNVIGTGPYVATEVSPTRITLAPNSQYWGSDKPKLDTIHVVSITEGDTLTMSLQSKEINIAQGLPYASLELFNQEEGYQISSSDTSRLYQVAFNYTSDITSDLAVRKAISLAIDKEQFTNVLLKGNGSPASAAFPSNFHFGNEQVTVADYDLEEAKKVLAEAGYQDTNNDGYLDKDNRPLTIRWLTYNSRQELPLLAEYAQGQLKEIGIQVEINATDNHLSVLETGQYDIYASAFVAAPTGDPEYYFTTHVLPTSNYNTGHYENTRVQELVAQLHQTFDVDTRAQLAIAIQQAIVDDSAYLFVSHLRMSFVMQDDIIGFTAHPSDYYEITSALDIGDS